MRPTITWRQLSESVGQVCMRCNLDWAVFDRVYTIENESPLLEGIVVGSFCDDCAKVVKDFEHQQVEKCHGLKRFSRAGAD